jgi:hypothetical protein
VAPPPTHPPFTQPQHTTPAASEPPAGILARWRAHRRRRTHARLISARNRRKLARWLRRTADHSETPHALLRRRETLMHHRVALVRTQLLEIAASLEHTPDPDPARIATLQNLLANGCDSPLYNNEVHVSELFATLHYIRDGLCQTIPTTETAPINRRRHATPRIPLRRLARSFAAWWADDSMNTRFEQQRAHDLQMLYRHDRR